MPTQLNGLPAHVLLIHVVIIFVPLAAGMLAVSALWPAARRKLGFLTPAVALVALVFVPITVHAGQWLRDRLPHNPAISKHAVLGATLLPWTIGLFVLAAAVWWLGRRYDTGWGSPAREDEQAAAPAGGDGAVATKVRPQRSAVATLPRWAVIVLAVLSVAVSIGSVVQLYRIGDSGAQAVWHGIGTSAPTGG